jgi:hypothetical protein
VNLNKVYDIRDFTKVTGTDPIFVIGAGAGPWPYAGVNCEVRCVQLSTRNIINTLTIFLTSLFRTIMNL